MDLRIVGSKLGKEDRRIGVGRTSGRRGSESPFGKRPRSKNANDGKDRERGFFPNGIYLDGSSRHASYSKSTGSIVMCARCSPIASSRQSSRSRLSAPVEIFSDEIRISSTDF